MLLRCVIYVLVITAITYIILANDHGRHPALISANVGFVSVGVFLVGESMRRMPHGPPNLAYYK